MSQRRGTAFTLIEMLLALTLTAVLLTIVSVTLGAVLRDNQRLDAMQASPVWFESVVCVMERDLRQSEAYQMNGGVLKLTSHAGVWGGRDHDAVTIEYEVEEVSGVFWLVRRVSASETTHVNSLQTALLCGGVRDLNLAAWSNEDQEPVAGSNGSPSSTSLTQEATPSLPGQLMLTVTLQTPTSGQASNDRTSSNNEPPQVMERLLMIH